MEILEHLLYEDDDMLVINKPYGLVVNRANTVKVPTVQDWMTEYLGEQSECEWQSLVPADFSVEYGTPEEIFSERNGIVHRLDKDTSGALVIAKNPGSLVVLLEQFRERKIQKTYTALVHGHFPFGKEIITLPIARLPKNTSKFGVVHDGRPAETIIETEQHFDIKKPDWPKFYGKFSLVKAMPKTGRTHQIRVHLDHYQHPIVSDKQYAGRKHMRLDLSWCPRQFLHASQITLTNPRTKEPLTVEAELAQDLKIALDSIQ
ncbi:MAG: RluA family pseudouridine synthase [Candidatus Pacebacteria bacterium CG_4_10_14_0_8_um_filter_42_14]|nr:MAG: RluA family pseudouridine synthase [Candidatus Pacebacteria bacterium CG_4_10_14_0_8_um_filter_42_14]